jgi:hypothetical protein
VGWGIREYSFPELNNVVLVTLSVRANRNIQYFRPETCPPIITGVDTYPLPTATDYIKVN